MKRVNKQLQGEKLFIGIDLHKHRWHVSIELLMLKFLRVELLQDGKNFEGYYIDIRSKPTRLVVSR